MGPAMTEEGAHIEVEQRNSQTDSQQDSERRKFHFESIKENLKKGRQVVIVWSVSNSFDL